MNVRQSAVGEGAAAVAAAATAFCHTTLAQEVASAEARLEEWGDTCEEIRGDALAAVASCTADLARTAHLLSSMAACSREMHEARATCRRVRAPLLRCLEPCQAEEQRCLQAASRLCSSSSGSRGTGGTLLPGGDAVEAPLPRRVDALLGARQQVAELHHALLIVQMWGSNKRS
eukprot:jgi/Mesen1/5348/ME000267S04499